MVSRTIIRTYIKSIKQGAEDKILKQQQQQMQEQLQMEEIKSRIKLTEARAVADEGLGIERLSRVQENEAFAVERRAEASKDRAQSALNIAKAIKELETMDLGQLQQLIMLSKTFDANTVEQIQSLLCCQLQQFLVMLCGLLGRIRNHRQW